MNLSSLKSHDFRLYLFGNFIFLNGMWIQRIVLGWLAWELTQSASYVGFIAFIGLAPTLLSGPFFGVIADRVNIKHAALFTYGAFIICSTLLYLVTLYNLLNPFILSVFCLIIGVIASANHPIRMSLAPRLVNQAQLPSVIALTSLNFNTSRLIGPAIGGLSIQFTNTNMTMLLTILFCLPISLIISFLNPRLIETEKKIIRKSIFSSLLDGAKLVAAHKIIKFAILFSGLTAFIGRGTLETLPVITEGIYSKGPSGLGIITASAGGGAIIAALFKVLMPSHRGGKLPLDGIVASILIPMAILLLGFATHFSHAVGLIFILGISTSIVGISMQSSIQMELTDEYRGRVMSIWTMISMGSAAFGALLMGFISDLIGIIKTQILLGIIFTLIIILVLFYNNFIHILITKPKH